MFSVNPDDPRSTAAAALSLAEELAATLDGTLARLPGRRAADALASLAGGLDGPRLFEERTLAALRRLRAEIAAGVARETGTAVSWEPVRYVDGAEDHAPVSVSRRTPEGDMLAATGARLDRLVALVERTRALLAADSRSKRAASSSSVTPARASPARSSGSGRSSTTAPRSCRTDGRHGSFTASCPERSPGRTSG
jgi:hypothetical protein